MVLNCFLFHYKPFILHFKRTEAHGSTGIGQVNRTTCSAIWYAVPNKVQYVQLK